MTLCMKEKNAACKSTINNNSVLVHCFLFFILFDRADLDLTIIGKQLAYLFDAVPVDPNDSNTDFENDDKNDKIQAENDKNQAENEAIRNLLLWKILW